MFLKMKYLILLVLVVLFLPRLKSQHSFILEHAFEYASQLSGLIETTDGHFILGVVCHDFNTTSAKTGKIIKVSPKGSILTQTDIGNEIEITTNINLHLHPENKNEFIVTGVCFDPVNTRDSYIHVLHFTDDIELIDQYYVHVPVYFDIFYSIIDEKNNIIAAGCYYDSNTNWLNIAIGRIDKNGHLKDFNMLEYENSQYLSDLIEDTHYSGTYGLSISGSVPEGNFTSMELFLSIDSLLTHTQTTQIPRITGLGNTNGLINTNGYMFAGKGYKSGIHLLNPFKSYLSDYLPQTQAGPDIYKSVVIKTDLEFNVSHEIVFGDGLKRDVPAPKKAVSVFVDSLIYTAGIKNLIPTQWPFQNEASWIRVNKLDNELNVIWEKYFGGDAYYQVNSVTATSVGGVILSGFKTYPGQAPLMNLLAIKLKADGTVSLDEYHADESTTGISVFPNPANTETQIQFTENAVLEKAMIELYSPSGRLLYSVKPTNYFHKIVLAHLSRGLYLVRLWDGERWRVQKLMKH